MGCSYILVKEECDKRGVYYDEEITNFITKAKSSTCKIILNQKKYGSGFFCKIPFTSNNNSYVNVLFTCEHVLSKELIFSDGEITILIDNKIKIITLKKTRKKWSDDKLDYSCIEIKEEDNIDNDYYQLDERILKSNYLDSDLKDDNIIIFSIMETEKRGHSSGIIKKIQNFYFFHDCNTYPGCSGGVIVNKKNNCVIGMHIGAYETPKRKNKITNLGVFIKDIIDNIKSNPCPLDETDNIWDLKEMNVIDEITITYKNNQNKKKEESIMNNNLKLFGEKFSKIIKIFAK